MNKQDAIKKIEEELSKRTKKIVSKNVISAALSLFSNPAQSVEKLFFGVENETSNEKLKIEQEIILDLICQISDSVNSMIDKLNSDIKSNSIVIDGLIEVKSSYSERAIGVDIKENSGQVEFKPGTQISLDTNNTNESIGLKIGGK